jgi:hypothetical protein
MMVPWRSIVRHLVYAVPADVLAMVVACGGGSGSSGEDPPPPRTARELCVELWGASSAKAVECLRRGASLAADELADGVAIACDRVQAGVDSRHLVPDAEAAEACIAAYGALTCAEYENHLDAPCDWLAGTIALGGACTSSDECAAGWCDHGSACPGTCAAFAEPGESCTTGIACGPGFACDFPEGVCAEAAPPGAEGEPCADARARCEAGLFCSGEVCVPRTAPYERCIIPGRRECTWSYECAEEGYGDLRCLPRLPEGASCTFPNGDRLDVVCVTGTYCDPGKCTPEALPVGASCALPEPGYWPCSRGYCDADLTCARWRIADEPCGPDALCNPYLECVNGVCSDVVCPG